MLNFVLGALAGGAITVVALAVGLRQPLVLERLDLAPKPPDAVQVARRTEPTCQPPQVAASSSQAGALPADSLFAPRRFWFVAP